MTDTANLALPFIDGSQAQKHVTHNEALRILDAAIQIGVLDMTLTVPPLTPADGERHVVASGATGAWSGQAMAVAVWEDGAWRFLAPKTGWLVWSAADTGLFVFDGSVWSGVSTGGGGTPTFDDVPHIGVNSTAADPNLLSVHSNAALFNSIDTADGGTGDARIQISKESSADTASVVFSDSFSGRAEFGLVGSDDFKLKVSDDGTTFVEAFTIDRSSGNLTLPRGLALSGVISPAQITANQNDYNPAGIASASVLQISSDASRTITGLAGGGEGRILCILNVGSQTITLADESTSSTAANRFSLGPNLAVASKQAVILRYDGTASRWFALARPSSGGGLSISTSADLASAISDETGSGALVFASSPALSGTPLAPTAAVDTNTTQIATTAFVLGQASASGDGNPAGNGTAARGTSTHYARADHVHPTDTSRAPASNIALSALAAQANNTFVGNVSGSSAAPVALTSTQVTAALAGWLASAGVVRDKITANRTYYVRGDGNDSNDGLSNNSGGAFLTIQKAIDTAIGLDLSIYGVTIQLTGNFTESPLLKSYVGAGPISIVGDETTPSNVTVTGTGAQVSTFLADGIVGKWVLAGMKLVNTGTSPNKGLIAAYAGSVIEFRKIEFGAAVNAQLQADTGALISLQDTYSYSISGGAPYHIQALRGGIVKTNGLTVANTITLSGTPAFSTAFMGATIGGLVRAANAYSGSATGVRYAADTNGVIATGGGGASFLPGNATGTTATGGQYT